MLLSTCCIRDVTSTVSTDGPCSRMTRKNREWYQLFSFVRDESSASNDDVPVIPSHLRITHQILSHWETFRDLKTRLTVSRRVEQLSLRCQQRTVATVEDSVLRTEMTGLESLEESCKRMTPSASSSTSIFVYYESLK